MTRQPARRAFRSAQGGRSAARSSCLHIPPMTLPGGHQGNVNGIVMSSMSSGAMRACRGAATTSRDRLGPRFVVRPRTGTSHNRNVRRPAHRENCAIAGQLAAAADTQDCASGAANVIAGKHDIRAGGACPGSAGARGSRCPGDADCPIAATFPWSRPPMHPSACVAGPGRGERVGTGSRGHRGRPGTAGSGARASRRRRGLARPAATSSPAIV
jgi:hypothetical protein